MNYKKIQDLLNESSKHSYYKLDYNKIYKKIEYAKNHQFLNIPVPEIRKISKYFYNIPYDELEKLIQSNINEEKTLCMEILIHKYQKNKNQKKEIFEFYLKNINFINFWNVIDISSDKIIGEFIFNNIDYLPILEKLSNSSNFWHKRIAIIATWFFIKNNNFSLTFSLCEKFLQNEHDLIYKACGWMLREIGKKDQFQLIEFLDQHYKSMPSIMKSYATERLSREIKNKFKKLAN
jgi:3-methyladenine DNA glycosylase AlkD